MKSSRDQFVDGADPGFAPMSRYGGGGSVGFGWFNGSGKSDSDSLIDSAPVGRGCGVGSSACFVSGIGYGTGTASGTGHCPGG